MADVLNTSRRGDLVQLNRDRKALLRTLVGAGAPVATALMVAQLVLGLLPAASAASLGWLVYRLDQSTADHVFALALPPFAVFAGVLLIGHLADAAVPPLEFLARARIDGEHRTQVIRVASVGLSIAELERDRVQALVTEVSADPKNLVEYTPGDGALSQLRWAAGIAGILASCLVVVQYRWWYVPWLLACTIVIRHIEFRRATAITVKLRLAYREEQYADVWRQAAISPAAGKDVRIFGFAEWMVRRIQDHIRHGNLPFWSAMEASVFRRWQIFLLIACGLLPVYVAVTIDAARGSATVATQTAVFAASLALFQAFSDPGDIHRMVGATQILHAFDELKDSLRAAPPSTTTAGPDAATALPRSDRPPLVRFEDVTFQYPGTDRTLLSHMDLEVRPGELLAIVGLNGAGKSTLIKLLAGLYEPIKGRITVDGVELGPATVGPWRNRLTVVFQDFVRYPLSAAMNVTLSRASVDDASVRLAEAAADSGFGEVLAHLPHGWETPLSRSRADGVDLSGGQWQQLVLTRAMYGIRTGAQLLVLDEPTAHLDVRTEFAVFQQLLEHRGDTSIVLISHRLSTVRQADRIVLLQDGRITETGTHDELIASGGEYAAMFEIQARRFSAGFDSRIEEGELR